MKPKLQKPQEPEPRGDVEVGDHIYVHHQGQPCTGVVQAHGRHGCTIAIDGQHHKVKWDKVLGHKKRAPLRYDVLEHGEDGMLVKDASGRRRFVKVPPEARDVADLAKSLMAPGALHYTEEITMKNREREVVLLFKALQQGNRQPDTDERKPGGDGWSERAPGAGAAQAGQHVAFKNGEHRGHGAVAASGEHGVTVRDQKGGEHRGRHEQVTREWRGEGEPDKAPPPSADDDDEVLDGYDGKVALPGELVAKLLQGAQPELRSEAAQYLREKAASDEVGRRAEEATPIDEKKPSDRYS